MLLLLDTDMHAGDATVFQDLGFDAKSYPKLPTTWNT
jgi:hypothetical protein